MRKFRLGAMLVAGFLGTLAGFLSQAIAAPEVAANPGAARVWFLWPSDSLVGYDTGATPTIYANGTPIGAIRGGSQFYRDFPPGTYQFSVDPYGLPTGQVQTLQLAPGSQAYLQVQWSPTWQQGYPGGWGLMARSFFILPMSPQLAQAYLPTLANLGPR
jgi:hypothetical protein